MTNIPQPEDEQNPNELPQPPHKLSLFRFLGVERANKKGNWTVPKCNRLEKMEGEPEVEAEATSLPANSEEEVVVAPETMLPTSVEELPPQEEFPPYQPWNGIFPSPTSPYGSYPPPYYVPPGYPPQWPFYPQQQPQPPYNQKINVTNTSGTAPGNIQPGPQMPDIPMSPGDQYGSRTVYFREQVTVFLDPEVRAMGLIIDDKDPAIMPHGVRISEKVTVHLILLLQDYLLKLRQLPIPPTSQDYI